MCQKTDNEKIKKSLLHADQIIGNSHHITYNENFYSLLIPKYKSGSQQQIFAKNKKREFALDGGVYRKLIFLSNNFPSQFRL